jgi:hypothetical protein
MLPIVRRIDETQKIALEFELKRIKKLAHNNEEILKSVSRIEKILTKIGVLR